MNEWRALFADQRAVLLNEHVAVPDHPNQHQPRPQRQLALEHRECARPQSDLAIFARFRPILFASEYAPS